MLVMLVMLVMLTMFKVTGNQLAQSGRVRTGRSCLPASGHQGLGDNTVVFVRPRFELLVVDRVGNTVAASVAVVMLMMLKEMCDTMTQTGAAAHRKLWLAPPPSARRR
jgi:hypothetical protein